MVCLAVRHALGVKIDIAQVLILCAGKRFFEQRQILFGFLLGHADQRVGEDGNRLALAVDIAALKAGNVVSIHLKTAANFV